MTFKLLLVEDDESDRQGFVASVNRYNHENDTTIQVVECPDVAQALERLDHSFDGAVIDMKLGSEGGEGNEILKALDARNVRIPIIILTGTPDDADDSFVHIEVKKKGEADNIDIIEDFHQIHASGLTKIMGARGLFETLLSEVYKNNILTQKDAWKVYGQEDADQSEKALMRHVLNHLVHMVDLDEESCVAEEFYIFPPMNRVFRTGSIVKSKADNSLHAIMNPACDLAVREDGQFKARNITLCRAKTLEECAEQEPKTAAQLKQSLFPLNKRNCYHSLPGTSFFGQRFLDFESIQSLPSNDVGELYEGPVIQIAPAFMKDIVARFSSFYGRQGQPGLTFA